MIAPGIDDIADRLLAGTIESVTASRILKAQAEGVAALEGRCAKYEKGAHAVILNTIGLAAAVDSLESELPVPVEKPKAKLQAQPA